MADYRYRDNIYGDKAAIRGIGAGWGHAQVALQALRYQQEMQRRQDDFERARLDMEADRIGMQREMQPSRLALMKAQAAQAELEQQTQQTQATAGQNIRQATGAATAMNANPDMAGNQEMIQQIVGALRGMGAHPQGETYYSVPRTDQTGPAIEQFTGLPASPDPSSLGKFGQYMASMVPNAVQGQLRSLTTGSPAAAERASSNEVLGRGQRLLGPNNEVLAQGEDIPDNSFQDFLYRMYLQDRDRKARFEDQTQSFLRDRNADIAIKEAEYGTTSPERAAEARRSITESVNQQRQQKDQLQQPPGVYKNAQDARQKGRRGGAVIYVTDTNEVIQLLPIPGEIPEQ